ncbi:MAG: nitrile hydratase subunit beta [Burkholderiales bacterium]
MDGIHDMGGMDGFGKVMPEENEPVFHAPWEARVYAMQRAMGFAGAWVIDQSRYAGEQLAPATYLSASYYDRWAMAIERNVLNRGLVGADELAAGRAMRPGEPLARKLTAEIVNRGLTRGGFSRPATAPAQFSVGERVRARNIHPRTHTRLPRYVRGHVGVIERVHGCYVYPDTVAIEAGENPQWLYVVRFDGSELWGPHADPTVKVSVDAFEPYLELAV